MLLRICLILAILAGIGTIVVTQVKVREHIQTLYNERDGQTKRAETAENKLAKTNAVLVKTTDRLRDTEKTLTDTRSTLKTSEANLAEANRDKDRLLKDLDTAKQAKIDSDAKLVKWESLGPSPEVIRQNLAELRNAREQIVVIETEKGILSRKNSQLQSELDAYLGKNTDPALPETLRGKVVAVDPKWDFVVLNIGAKDSVLERGVLLVHRDSRLVAKVRVTKVLEDRSIANIVPGASVTDIQEGDKVLPAARNRGG